MENQTGAARFRFRFHEAVRKARRTFKTTHRSTTLVVSVRRSFRNRKQALLHMCFQKATRRIALPSLPVPTSASEIRCKYHGAPLDCRPFREPSRRGCRQRIPNPRFAFRPSCDHVGEEQARTFSKGGRREFSWGRDHGRRRPW